MSERLPAVPQDLEDYIGVGGLPPAAHIGRKEFEAHDHGPEWDDGGMGQQLATSLVEDFKLLAAEQAKRGALEYAGNGILRAIPVQGQLCAMLDSSNKAVKFGVCWKLLDVILKDLDEALTIGDDRLADTIRQHAQDLSAQVEARFRVETKPELPQGDVDAAPAGANPFAGRGRLAGSGGTGKPVALAPPAGTQGKGRGRAPGAVRAQR